MKIIISPAKKMRHDPDSLPCRDLPIFLENTRELAQILRKMNPQELKKLWNCSDAILEQNLRRLETMDLEKNLTPAVLAYEGIQYQHMAPGVFSDREFAYLQEHLRILSGFYGVLRPFDGVTPYRLEMQAKLAAGQGRDLYAYWGEKPARAVLEGTSSVLNLASKEYSIAVSRHLPEDFPFITCVFGEKKGEKMVEKGTLCKMARGEMVRFLAENQIREPAGAKAFRGLDFAFSEEHSTDSKFVFIRNTT